MKPTTRFLLVLACLVVAALESPRAAAVMVEDLAGPYSARAVDVPSVSRASSSAGAARDVHAVRGARIVVEPTSTTRETTRESHEHADALRTAALAR